MKNNLVNKNNLRVLIMGSIIVIGVGFLGSFFYFFELFSHFYLQYFGGMIILLVLSIILKEKVSIITCMIVSLFLGINISNSTIIEGEQTGNFDMYYLNANFFINNPDPIIKDIKKHNPKYLAIIELNPSLYKKIKQDLDFKNEYYFNSGVASFGFFTNEKIIENETIELSYPIGKIKINETDILLVHPLPGLNKSLHSLQKKNFLEINELFTNIKNDKKMILGDFNSSSYSQIFKKHFGKYYYKTIYSRNIKGILMLPIDYAIGNKKFYSVNRSNLTTSDHSPLLINFDK